MYKMEQAAISACFSRIRWQFLKLSHHYRVSVWVMLCLSAHAHLTGRRGLCHCLHGVRGGEKMVCIFIAV